MPYESAIRSNKMGMNYLFDVVAITIRHQRLFRLWIKVEIIGEG
jgi:hypothetical protein